MHTHIHTYTAHRAEAIASGEVRDAKRASRRKNKVDSEDYMQKRKVCMYVCMYVCVCIYVILMYTYMHTRLLYLGVCIYVCMRVHICNIHVYVYAHTFTLP